MPSIGTRIPFVIVAGKGLFVDRAEDPDYVREHNVHIDVDYYVKKQILPPVERILGVFGVNVSSLDFDSKQKGYLILRRGSRTQENRKRENFSVKQKEKTRPGEKHTLGKWTRRAKISI